MVGEWLGLPKQGVLFFSRDFVTARPPSEGATVGAGCIALVEDEGLVSV